MPGRMARLLANGELLHGAIETVVRNALRYSPTGSVVRIEAWVCESGAFRISILDCGPGVGASDVAAIFTPFFPGNATVSNGGYGLGLAIARRVVESIHGAIVAESRKNAGLSARIKMQLSLH